MSLIYRGQDTEVRVLGTETIDYTTPDGDITRTFETYDLKALVGPEKKAKEGHTRNFSFMVETYPEDPPSTTTRIVYNGLEYEISGYSTDGVVFDISTYRP